MGDTNEEAGPTAEGAAAGPARDDRPTQATGGESSDRSPELLGRRGQEYLAGLLDNIGTMLAYMQREGIAMPDELRGKLDELMRNPELENYPLNSKSSGDKRGKWSWLRVS